MRLRARTLLIVLGLMAATLLVTDLVGRLLIYPRFVELEQDQARRNAEMVIEIANRELEMLAPQSEDWGYWDDTYRFVADRNDAYADANLGIDSQYGLKANFLGMYDLAGNAVWSRGLDFDGMKTYALEPLAATRLPADFPLLIHSDRPQVRVGLIATAHGPILLAAAPILDSQRQGPRRGTLIIGRYFNSAAIIRIAGQALLKVKLSPPAATAARVRVPLATSLRLIHSPFAFQRSNHHIEAISTLFGLDGKPTMVLRVITPGAISERGRTALRTAMIGIAVCGLLITAILLWLLDSHVIEPIRQLRRIAQQVGTNGDSAARASLQRKDEIGELSREFNRMLGRMDDTRRRLLEQSYQAGASEMAGGVIRDLRESLVPIKAHIEHPIQQLDKAQSVSQHMLLQQLTEQELSRPRQIELLHLLSDNCHEQSGILAEARGDLRMLRRRIVHLQDIVSEYARFVGSTAQPEAVEVPALINHAQRMLASESAQAMELEIDSSALNAAPVKASREILQQVIGLLLSHAATALRQCESGRGVLRVTAASLSRDGRDWLHFRFDDNRPTLSPEDLQALFQRDGTTDGEMNRIGLAWAENAIAAMGGQLYAEASQPYDGVVIHLLLPKA